VGRTGASGGAPVDPVQGDTKTVDDVLRALLITLGVLVVAGLALVAFLMWRFKIPPRGVVAMLGALAYLALPVDVVPEALLGPLGLVDDTGVVAVVAIWVYKLVKARQRLVEGGVIKRPPVVTGDE
jgi:uncharacterized membrane protein YkvA (DUF1232 family)